MKKNIYNILLILIFSFFIVGCDSKEEILNKNANCKLFDCINKIEPENTVDEINDIVGFKGENTDKKYKIYNWKISDTESIQVAYYSSEKSQIKTNLKCQI